jgi:signal transduction histidine kinase
VVDACAYPFRHADDIIIRTDIHPQLRVMADEVELARVLSNLLENARRYGKSPQTGVAVVEIAARQREDWVLIKVRDHGIGVSPEALDKLTKPFFRGDAARTAATGAGWGSRLSTRPCSAWAAPSCWPTAVRVVWPPTSGCTRPNSRQPRKFQVFLA